MPCKAARLVARHGAGPTAAGVGILAGYAAVAVVGGKRGLYSSDGRPPTDRTMKTGFTSQKDLSVPANRTEAR